MSAESEKGILTDNVDTIDLSPADYSIVTSVGGKFDGPEGRWGLVCGPEDGRALTRVGIFVCEPHKIEVPLKSDELMYMLEGDVRVELDDGSAVELSAGDMAVLPKDRQITLNYKTQCKQMFVTVK
jgi:uncharacterized cupin superfamily protein